MVVELAGELHHQTARVGLLLGDRLGAGQQLGQVVRLVPEEGEAASATPRSARREARRSGGTKAAWKALRVKPRRLAGEKPRAAARAYSRSIVVQTRTGSSVLRVTGMPHST